MKTYAVLYIVALVVFLAIDLAWLGLIARDFYRNGLGALLTEKLRMDIGLVFYVLYVVGLAVFALRPGVEANGWQPALIYGGLFGFFAYATYDLTNLATLKNYPLSLALADLAWGTALSGATSAIAIVIGKALLGDLRAG
jgi:uncharacterized membrane protein